MDNIKERKGDNCVETAWRGCEGESASIHSVITAGNRAFVVLRVEEAGEIARSLRYESRKRSLFTMRYEFRSIRFLKGVLKGE